MVSQWLFIFSIDAIISCALSGLHAHSRPPLQAPLGHIRNTDKANMLMYRGRKDTYWFQPAIVRIAYRMSSLELSYFGHVFLCGCVCQCVGVDMCGGGTVCGLLQQMGGPCRRRLFPASVCVLLLFFLWSSRAPPRGETTPSPPVRLGTPPTPTARTPPTWCTPCWHIILPLLQLNLN